MKATLRKPPADAERSLQAFANSPGRPLDEPVRQEMERELGHDFSRVRVFDDAGAGELAEAFQADAFAVGQSVFFGPGRYRPRTPEGRELLAHELAHTVQQRHSIPVGRLQAAAPEAETRADGVAPQPAMPMAVARRSTSGPLDPVRLDQALARLVVRNLRRDPNDARGDVRRQLQRLAPSLRTTMLERLRISLTDAEMEKVRELLGKDAPATDESPKEAPASVEAPPEKAPEPTEAKAPETKATEVPVEEETPKEALPQGEKAEDQPKAESEGDAKKGEVEGGEAPSAEEESANASEAAPGAAGAATPVLVVPAGDANADPNAVDRIENAVPPVKEEPDAAVAEPAATEDDQAPAMGGAALEDEPLGVAAESELDEARAETAVDDMPAAAMPEPAIAPEEESVEEAVAAPVEEPEAAGGGLEPSVVESGESPSAEVQTPVGSEGGEGGGGGCGGGAGGAPPAATEEAPPAPPAGGTDPSAVLAGVSGATPVVIGGSLATAQAAAGTGVEAQRTELAANPPTMERPTGAPAGARPAPRDVPGLPGAPTVAKVEIGTPGKIEAAVASGPAGEGPNVFVPKVFGTPEGKLTEADAGRMAGAVDELPTTDPELNVTAEAPATMELDGAADPAQAETQHANVMAAGKKAHADARADALKPRGEQGIYPKVAPETLTGKPCPGAAASPQAITPPAADRNVGALAESEKGAEVRASVGEAQGQMSDARTKQEEDQARERQASDEKVQTAIDENANAQAKTRRDTQKDVGKVRDEWTKAQDGALADADRDGSKAAKDARNEIVEKKKQTDGSVEADVKEGNRRIGEAREKAESDARAKKKEADNESSGFFGWVADKVSSFFNAIKNAIKSAFAWARDKVKVALTWVRDKVVAAIEAARKWVVDKIRKIADAILAIADVLLAAFPELREKFHAVVEKAVQVATDAVNKLADDLKAGVNAFFDKLMCALDALLGALLSALLAAVDFVASAVDKAIQFAKLIADGLGQFLELVADIASDPGGWISNLASSAAAGVKNCLWAAFKAAVKQWFNDKVEEVVGMGKAIWNVLTKGGISLSRIGAMAWEGIKAAIPMALISIVVEKLVSLIIPAAGAVLLVIQGLIAAWGAIKRILAALGLVFQYLKSVAGGGSPGLFAQAVSASAVAVIDFVANWLIARLARGAGKRLAKAFQNLAKRIMATLKKAAKAVKKGASAAGRAVKKGAQKVVAGAKAVGRKIANSGAVKALKKTRVGKAVANAYGKAKQGAQNLKDRYRKWREKRAERRKNNAQERLEKAVTAGLRALAPFAGKRKGRLAVQARLLPVQARYRILYLRPVQEGSRWAIEGKVNPVLKQLADVVVLTDPHEADRLFLRHALQAESTFFNLVGIQGPGMHLRTPQQAALDQKLASGVHPRGPTPSQVPDITGVSSREQIESGLRMQRLGIGGQGDVLHTKMGDMRMRDMLNPSGANPMNRFTQNIGSYSAEGGRNIPQTLARLQKLGLTGPGISQMIEESARSGQPITANTLAKFGFKGKNPDVSARALNRITHLTSVVEPMRFLNRGVSSMSPLPVGLSTAMGHQMVQGGAMPIQSLFGQGEFDAKLAEKGGPIMTSKAPFGPALGAAAPPGATQNDTQTAALIGRVRRHWSDWERAKRQDIQNLEKDGQRAVHLVPTVEAMLGILRRFYGDERSAVGVNP